MDFFQHHGWLFLIAVTIFPRLTLLFSSVISGGVLWWLGFFLTPHLLVAFLSLPYWDSNPALVAIAWIVAIFGTGSEGKVAKRRVSK